MINLPTAGEAATPCASGVESEALRGRRVLVTGARGFLGSHLCEALRSIDANVFAVVRGDVARPQRDVSYICADLANTAAARAAIEQSRPEVVFLLTSLGIGSPELTNVAPTIANDFLANVNVLTAAVESGCARVVMASSMEEPAEARAIPGSPYAAAKWAATGYARMFHDLYKAPLVIARPFMTYGPRQRTFKVVPYTILSFLRGQSPLLSSGRRLVDWVYVDDTVRGLLAAGALPGLEGGEFDLGSGTRVSVKSVVDRIRRLIGSSAEPIFGGVAERPKRRARAADTCTTFVRLGWKAEVSLDAGLLRTIEWYRAHSGLASSN
jgi:UDP-glucose 4-epimerase